MSLEAELRLRQGALDLDVKFSAGADETVAVVGPNGAGKTTLLRAIAGLVPCARAVVRCGARVFEDSGAGVRLAPEARQVGIVFQDLNLLPHLDAADNIGFALRVRGSTRQEARAVAITWLERFEIAAVAGSRPWQLSGGQKQRVALARALAFGPDLLLLDEPLSAADEDASTGLRRLLKQHLAERGRPRLLVTHDPLQAITLADRLVVLEAGRVMQSGTVAEVTARPRSAYAARLLGLNLLQAQANGAEAVLAGGAALHLAEPTTGRVLVLVPPQAVTLHPEQPSGSARNVWRLPVLGVDIIGNRARVSLGGGVPVVAEVTMAAVRELGLGDGGLVWAAVKATELVVYPV
ncbi:MAG: sulfate/molybdate ABC transporter ATP-binding protein [Candidatus Dormibacteria bacterium]